MLTSMLALLFAVPPPSGLTSGKAITPQPNFRRPGTSSNFEREDLPAMKQLTRVPETSLNILNLKMRIAREDLFLTPSGGEKVDNDLHRNSRPFDRRLARQHFRIHCNPLPPVHVLNLSEVRAGAGPIPKLPDPNSCGPAALQCPAESQRRGGRRVRFVKPMHLEKPACGAVDGRSAQKRCPSDVSVRGTGHTLPPAAWFRPRLVQRK